MYTGDQTVTLSSSEANGITYYTIDGTEPITESPVYNGEKITVSKDSPYLVDEMEPEMVIDEETGQLTPTGKLVPTGRKMVVVKAFTTAAGKWDSSIVTYEYVIDETEPDPPTPVPPGPTPQDPVTITYDLNGGTYNGSPEDIVETYERGTAISIHAAPVRDGYTFLYWKGSEYQPNDTYEAVEDHTFVAQWEKGASPGPTPGPTPAPTPAKSGMPSIGDTMPAGPALLSALVLCGAVALIAARRMRADSSRDWYSKK